MIAESIKIWEEVVKSKDGDKPGWAYEKYVGGCPFCQEQDIRHVEGCKGCPIAIEASIETNWRCLDAWQVWAHCEAGSDKIAAAKIVLEELKSIDKIWEKGQESGKMGIVIEDGEVVNVQNGD